MSSVTVVPLTKRFPDKVKLLASTYPLVIILDESVPRPNSDSGTFPRLSRDATPFANPLSATGR